MLSAAAIVCGFPAVWCVQSHGHLVLSGATDGSLRAWDLRDACKSIHSTAAHADAIAGLQLDEAKIVTSSFDSTVRLWDIRKGFELRATLHAPVGTRCTRLAYDDTRIVTGSLNQQVVCFDLL